MRGVPKSIVYQSSRLPLDQQVQRLRGSNGSLSGFSTLSGAKVNDAEAVISLRATPS